MRDGAASPLAARLRDGGASLGEVFAFMSSLYFRGKLTYAKTFCAPPAGWPGVLVIAPGRGLVDPDVMIRVSDLLDMAGVPVDDEHSKFREPLMRDARALAPALGDDGRAVLLGSVATDKYVEPLVRVFGDRLVFPPTFAGRGDMSRGGLILRCASANTPLEYVPVRGAPRHGPKPAKLGRVPSR
jgi:hypothetical protein